MKQDLRLWPITDSDKFRRLALENWSTLSAEQKDKLIADPPCEERQAEGLPIAWTMALQRSYARMRRDIDQVVHEHMGWNAISEIAESKRDGVMFVEALDDLRGEEEGWVIHAAKAHLADVAESHWLWQPKGFGRTVADREGPVLYLDFWSRYDQTSPIDRGDLTEQTALALRFLAGHDRASFLSVVMGIREPRVMWAVGERYFEEPDFSLSLVGCERASVCSLGLHGYLYYLGRLESYGYELVRSLTPFDDQIVDTVPVVERRQAVADEIDMRVSELVAKLGGGAAHVQLLAELLVQAYRFVVGNMPVVGRAVRDAVGRSVASRILKTPDAEDEVIQVLRRADPRAMAVGQSLGSTLDAIDRASAKRWRLVVLRHFEERLIIPEDVKRQGVRSSKSDPLNLINYSMEWNYLSNVSATMADLERDGTLSVYDWFEAAFRLLPPLGERRNRQIYSWFAANGRVAALMLVAAALLSNQADAGLADLANLLSKELERRIRDWERFLHLGFRVGVLQAPTIEDEAVRQLSEALSKRNMTVPTDEVTSACTLLELCATNADDQLRSRVAIDLEANLRLLDQPTLIRLMWQFVCRGWWEELGLAVDRYRQQEAFGPAKSLPNSPEVMAVRCFEALKTVRFTNASSGHNALIRLCEEIERYDQRDPRVLGIYLIAARLRQCGEPLNKRLEQTTDNVSRYLNLLGVRKIC